MHASIFTERTAQKCTQCACNACNCSNSLWTARACYTEVDSVLCHGYAKMEEAFYSYVLRGDTCQGDTLTRSI